MAEIGKIHCTTCVECISDLSIERNGFGEMIREAISVDNALLPKEEIGYGRYTGFYCQNDKEKRVTAVDAEWRTK
ncbi:MAG: hypothetical protein IKX20_05095 [Paludibacteraceae bacterium]|nr:hypothetical protein [Paludibacteraceae bacterium]